MWTKDDFLTQFLDRIFARLEFTCTDRARVDAFYLQELPQQIDGKLLRRVLRNLHGHNERVQLCYRHVPTLSHASSIAINDAVEELLIMNLRVVESGGTECLQQRTHLKEGVACFGHHTELIDFLFGNALVCLFRCMQERKSITEVLASAAVQACRRMESNQQLGLPIQPKVLIEFRQCIA